MARSRRKWDANRDGPLAEPVDRIRLRGLAAFSASGLYDDEVAVLLELASTLYPDLAGRSSPEPLLHALLADAIRHLDHPAEQRAAPLVFGMVRRRDRRGSRDDSHSYGLALDSRRELAAHAYRAGGAHGEPQPHTFRTKPQYERTIVVHVARAIEQLAQLGPPGPPHNTSVRAGYVPRPALEAELREANAAHKLLVLVGPAGIGKTTAALQYASMKAPPDQVAILRGTDRETLLLDIRLALGPEADPLADSAVLLHLRALLADRRRAPRCVVIDNVEDWRLIAPLLPDELWPTVLVTTRHEPAERPGALVAIGPLTHHEAEALVRARLPDATTADAALLATTLGGHALAIDHACGFIASDDELSVAAFCASVPRHAAQLFDDAAPSSLTYLYRQTMVALHEQVPQAAYLLQMLSFLRDEDVYEDFLARSLATVLGLDTSEPTIARAVLRRAAAVLAHRHLVTMDAPGERRPGMCKMDVHDLTRHLVNGLLDADTGSALRSTLCVAGLESLHRWDGATVRDYETARSSVMRSLIAAFKAPASRNLGGDPLANMFEQVGQHVPGRPAMERARWQALQREHAAWLDEHFTEVPGKRGLWPKVTADEHESDEQEC